MADQTYTKLDLATKQLDDAISLFLKRHYVSALTLAGAADEILSKALSHRDQQDALEWKREALEPRHTWLHGRSLSRAELCRLGLQVPNIREENNTFISVTRTESASEPSDTLDLEEAALWTIVRACDNSDRLGLPRTARMLEFENWFYEHVVGDMVGDVA